MRTRLVTRSSHELACALVLLPATRVLAKHCLSAARRALHGARCRAHSDPPTLGPVAVGRKGRWEFRAQSEQRRTYIQEGPSSVRIFLEGLVSLLWWLRLCRYSRLGILSAVREVGADMVPLIARARGAGTVGRRGRAPSNPATASGRDGRRGGQTHRAYRPQSDRPPARRRRTRRRRTRGSGALLERGGRRSPSPSQSISRPIRRRRTASRYRPP